VNPARRLLPTSATRPVSAGAQSTTLCVIFALVMALVGPARSLSPWGACNVQVECALSSSSSAPSPSGSAVLRQRPNLYERPGTPPRLSLGLRVLGRSLGVHTTEPEGEGATSFPPLPGAWIAPGRSEPTLRVWASPLVPWGTRHADGHVSNFLDESQRARGPPGLSDMYRRHA